MTGEFGYIGGGGVSSSGEAAFEAHIADWLVEYGGYRRVKVGNLGTELSDFDPAAGVDTADLFEFIGATQSGIWGQLVNAGYSGDVRQARARFVKRLASELDRRGTVDVLPAGGCGSQCEDPTGVFQTGSWADA